jgi:NADH dehydrogenase (ubiquinone) flavoprotein 2
MSHTNKKRDPCIQICGTTPCRLQGAQQIQAALEQHLGIHLGQTTSCGTFTLGEMECMGACVNAPMIVVSDFSNGVKGYSYNYFEDLTPEDAVRIADSYKAGNA